MNTIGHPRKDAGQAILALHKIHYRTVSELRRRGHSAEAIAEMTPETAYAEYCAFHGIFDPAKGPANILADLQQAAIATASKQATTH